MFYLYLFITVETVSLFLTMTRWSKRYTAGEYFVNKDQYYGDKLLGTTTDDNSSAAFFAHLGMGLVPIIGFAFLTGEWLNKREQKALDEQKFKALEEARLDKLLMEKR